MTTTRRDIKQLERVIGELEYWQNTCKDDDLTLEANQPKNKLMEILTRAESRVKP
jgi:hypothetical protein